MKVSIIIPTFNEGKTVLQVIKRVQKLPFEKEIIVINDGSQDNTASKLDKLKGNGIVVHTHVKNQGKGAAVRTGLRKATGEIIAIQDADLEYCPEELCKLVNPILAGEADVVFGSRFLGEERPSFGSYGIYYLGNRFLTHLTRVLFSTNITDLNTCYKVFHKRALRGVKLHGNRFELDPEITAKVLRKKVRFLEFPVSYKGRSRKDGKKITWKDGIRASLTLIRYRMFR